MTSLRSLFISKQQAGAILIIVLWFIVIVTVIVAALASETRLSAQIVFYNKAGLQSWNDTLKALAAAQMELLINLMPDPPGQEQEVPLSERKNKRYRFDGRVLELAYPIADTVTVRIYDHAGKINIQRLSKRRMRQLLEKRVGTDPEKLTALENAWEDWIDRNDLKRANGAEKDYYETLSPPYEPRNSALETVEELLLIKGFAEVFEGVAMDAAFTVHSHSFGVNPNLATKEALMLIPGLNEELVNTILTKRREKEFKKHSDFNEFIEPEQLAKIRPWINFATSNVYTIAIQTKNPQQVKSDDNNEEDTKATEPVAETETAPTSTQPAEQQVQNAYLAIVQPRGFNQLPRIFMVNPYGVLPDTSHETRLNQTEETQNNNQPSTTTPFNR